MASRNKPSRPIKKPRLGTLSGFRAYVNAQINDAVSDILNYHVYPRLGWPRADKIARSCKRWKIWCKSNQEAHEDTMRMGVEVAMKKWLVFDVAFNNGNGAMEWLEDDMANYFDGFPLMFGTGFDG